MLSRNIAHPPKRLASPGTALAGIILLFAVSANPASARGRTAGSGDPEGTTARATSAPYRADAAFAASPYAAAQAGFGPLDPTPPKDITVDQIIKKFGERESAFAQARNQYTYRQTVKVDTVNDDTGKPDGEYQQVTDVVFSDDGARSEHVIFAPANTIQKVIMSENDFADIEHRLPFVLTTPELPEYDLTYLGRQKVDDIDTYVFDCRPKTLAKGKRYFQGKVWVDQLEDEIVLINGKAVPDNMKAGHEDLSPPYTTYYQEVDGGNWFPVYTKADGILHFPAGPGYLQNDVHLRYVVKYEDYKRFHAKSRIIYNGEDLPPADPNAKPGSTPAATPAAAPDAGPNALPPPDPDAPPLTRPASTPAAKPNG
jgi:hypothetical protein